MKDEKTGARVGFIVLELGPLHQNPLVVSAYSVSASRVEFSQYGQSVHVTNIHAF
jgi:hypothetical protein